ncbi:Class I glutamine amidotransferase-like protein [Tylopilus felleus]
MGIVRLAVLLCDEIIMRSPPIVDKFGDYQTIFRRFLSSSLEEITSDVNFTLDGYDVVNDMVYPPEDTHYDAILISGSRTSVSDDLPWVKKLVAYVQHIVDRKPSLKIFGICFGHQIISMALGGTAERGDWEVSVMTMDLTRLGKAIFHARKLVRLTLTSYMHASTSKLIHYGQHLQLFHHDHVTKSASDAHLLGWSVIADNQGTVIFHPDLAPPPEALESDALRVDLTSIHVLTFQGHPEFTKEIMLKLIAESAGELPHDLVDDAIARAGLPTDAIDKVGRVLWGILGVTSEC